MFGGREDNYPLVEQHAISDTAVSAVWLGRDTFQLSDVRSDTGQPVVGHRTACGRTPDRRDRRGGARNAVWPAPDGDRFLLRSTRR